MTTNTTEIIADYTTGNISLEEANRRLAEAGASFVLDPDRCKLNPDMIEQGWGLLDTGTGTLDPVQVRDNELVDNDMGDMPAFVCLAGTWLEVKGRNVIR